MSDEANCRLKGWMAISCLIRNFAPALHAFEERDGFKSLLSTLGSEDVRLQRRSLFLMQYLLPLTGSDNLKLTRETGSLQKVMRFVGSEDLDVREKAIGVLIAVAKKGDGRGDLLKDTSFGHKLLEVHDEIKQADDDERESRASELDLVEELRRVLDRKETADKESGGKSSPVRLLKS